MIPSLFTAVCFAMAAISARQSGHLLGSGRANWYRLVFAALILSGVSAFHWEDWLWSAGVWLMLAGGMGFGLGGYCMMQALQRLGSPPALLLVESVTAILSGGLAWWLLHDTLTLTQIGSCTLILSGILIAAKGCYGKEPKQESQTSRSGLLYAVMAALFQAISLVASRHAFLLAQDAGIDLSKFGAAFVRLTGGIAIASFLLLVLHLCRTHRVPANLPGHENTRGGWRLDRRSMFWVSLNTLFGPVLGVTCWLWAVSMWNPGLVQSVAATAPLISIPLSRRMEQQPVESSFCIGAPIAIVGISLLMLG